MIVRMMVVVAGWLVVGVACSTSPVESMGAVSQEAAVRISCPGEAAIESERMGSLSSQEDITTATQLYATRDLALQNNNCENIDVPADKAQQHYKAANDKAKAACETDLLLVFRCEEPCKRSLDKNTCAVVAGWPSLSFSNEARELTLPDGTKVYQAYCTVAARSFAEGTAVAICKE